MVMQGKTLGQNSISGAIVPVAEAIARVVQDLMAAKSTVLDRGLSGESKRSAIESGQLMMDDNALDAAVRAIFTKNNAAVTELGQLDKVKKTTKPCRFTIGSYCCTKYNW